MKPSDAGFKTRSRRHEENLNSKKEQHGANELDIKGVALVVRAA